VARRSFVTRVETTEVDNVLEFPPNITALYQAILFVALWIVLKRLVWDRFVQNLLMRQRKTQGALEEAKRLREEATRLRSEYESAMVEIHRQAVEAREEIHRQAEKEERQLIDGARGEAAKLLEEARLRIEHEMSSARATLERETDELSQRVARTLLGRSS
jgi:F-type H+-transporting ATPase subunit b